MTQAAGVQHSSAGSLFAVTQSAADSIAIVDLSTRSTGSIVRATIPVGTAPWGIAVDGPARRAYVATAPGVAIVDLLERRTVALVPYRDAPASHGFGEYRPGGTGIVVSDDGERVFVAVHRDGRFSTVEVLDTSTQSMIASVDVGERPFDVKLSADGSEVYTIDHDSFTMHAVSVDGFAVRSYEIAPFGTAGGHMSHFKPHYAAVAADGVVYLPYQGRAVVVLDPATGAYETRPLTGDTHQHGTDLSDDGRLLVVGVGEVGGATRGPSLTVYDVETGGEQLIELDRGHENVLFWREPGSSRPLAILTGGSTSRGPWDGLTLVDLDTHEITHLPVPEKPQAIVRIAD
ncbi:YncE family protein [Microbacterium marinilacus]|nr:YncE family protein [Microbacterium marinilacus]MBY0690497.1 YncE family protein [Microbacterium marinilacus]